MLYFRHDIDAQSVSRVPMEQVRQLKITWDDRDETEALDQAIRHEVRWDWLSDKMLEMKTRDDRADIGLCRDFMIEYTFDNITKRDHFITMLAWNINPFDMTKHIYDILEKTKNDWITEDYIAWRIERRLFHGCEGDEQTFRDRLEKYVPQVFDMSTPLKPWSAWRGDKEDLACNRRWWEY